MGTGLSNPAAEIERLRAELAETTTAFWRESNRADKAEADRDGLVEAATMAMEEMKKHGPHAFTILQEAIANHGGQRAGEENHDPKN